MWKKLQAASRNFRSDALYGCNFPEWFVGRAETFYNFDWERIIRDLRSSQFFYPGYCNERNNITGQFLDREHASALAEQLIQALAALIVVSIAGGDSGEFVRRHLELDGYSVDKAHLQLVPLEGPISEAEEEELLTTLIRQAGFPSESTIVKHMADARNEYVGGNHHPSLNESRSFIQGMVDDIAVETDRTGNHGVGLPAGIANRISYLRQVGFFTSDDEKAAFGSAWGTLCAGSHPGVPARHEARIGLVLALEFGQLLALKFLDWKTNQYSRFSNP